MRNIKSIPIPIFLFIFSTLSFISISTVVFFDLIHWKTIDKGGYIGPYNGSANLVKSNQSLAVTRIIHQSWKNETIPDIFRRYVPSWRKCFPDYEYKFWADADNRNLIVSHYKWFLAKYDSLPAPIYRADCARYFYMLHYGGIYTDLDNECLFPFEHLLLNHSLVFGAIDNVNRKSPLNNTYVQNSFMYSRPNHPFWLELILEILNSQMTSRPDISTGPEVLAKVIHRYRTRYPDSKEIRIYEGRYFNPLTWGQTEKNPPFCEPFNMKEVEYQKCREYFVKQGSYVVQYHTHVWG